MNATLTLAPVSKPAWPVSSSYQRQYVNRPWVPVRPVRAA